MTSKNKKLETRRGNVARLPEYREFVKENGEKLYNFCFLLLPVSVDTEEFVISVLRDFGDDYRKWAKVEPLWEASEVRCKLFKLGWERVRDILACTQAAWTVGRDTREIIDIDRDLLSDGPKQLKVSSGAAAMEELILDRVRWVDPDFRATFVLRDLIGLDDEEVIRVLGLRWGVYRNRLNRGRLDFKDCLKGRPSASSHQGPFPEVAW